MWIDETASEQHLRTWIKHCPAMKLVSTLDGRILWANAAFCDWSQYTLTELRKLTWMAISVPDKNLESDIDEAKNLDAYNPTYQIKKQYIPKGSKPEWGQLTAMRYTLSGEIECCLCTWEPLKNGTATAFAMAMEHTQKTRRKNRSNDGGIKGDHKSNGRRQVCSWSNKNDSATPQNCGVVSGSRSVNFWAE